MKDNEVTLCPVDRQSPDIDRFREMYESSFPPEERRPWPDMLFNMDDDERFAFLGAYDGSGRAVGFITLWNLGQITYCEHFAVDGALRGRGIGSRVIGRARDMIDSPLILEVEPLGATAEADRRIAFYRRHGFALCQAFDYIQPSYGPGLSPVRLMLMVSDERVDLDVAARLIHKYVYGVDDE